LSFLWSILLYSNPNISVFNTLCFPSLMLTLYAGLHLTNSIGSAPIDYISIFPCSQQRDSLSYVNETTTSPRAAPKKTSKRSAPAAATATAEGRARKKRGGRPADSPPSPKRTRVVDVETGLVEDVIAAVPLRSAAPPVQAGGDAGGPLLVPLSPKEKDSDDDNDVRIVSSVGDAPRGHCPTTFGPEAPQGEDKTGSTSTSSSSSSSEGTEQSASPSATAAEKDDFVAAAEEEEEEEPDSSSYRVTPEEPRAAVVRLQVPAEAKLIGGKKDSLPGPDKRRTRAPIPGGGRGELLYSSQGGILREA
jgi:hypothetical protein